MRPRRAIAAIAAGAAALLMLSACAGLPTTGDVSVGLELGESPDDLDFLPLASGPARDAGPTEIVEGFMEAAITPADNWQIARSFLTAEFSTAWRPSAGVSIDASAAERTVTSSVDEEAEDVADGETAEVVVLLDQIASVDESGAYSEKLGAANLAFVVARTEGQWRIAEAPDGVVIDESRFSRVYDHYALQYFDHTWTRLVPDVRWFPRRDGTATTITRALINGMPSAWLEPAVQSAFPADVQLTRDAVPISAELVADVELNGAAAGLDQQTLARMRTQLQQTLIQAGVRVTQVRFSVEGRALEAGVVKLADDQADAGTVALMAGAFGTVVGDDVVPIEGVSEEILAIPQPVTAIDVAADDSAAAVQLADGRVFLAGGGRLDELDARAALVKPSMDPQGFTWSVPSNDPRALTAWGGDVAPHQIAGAWPDASSISHLRVSVDGARVAAVITVGGQRWVVVAAVIRDDAGVPVELGRVQPLTRLRGDAAGLVWIGGDRLGILADVENPQVLTQIVGGTGTAEAAPTGAVSIAGSRTAAGVRVRGADGAVFARSGTAWQESLTGVLVLATRAGH